MDIFYKDTDSKQCMLFYSCHPRSTKVNIPYKLARRIRSIVSEEDVLKRRMEELKSFLNKQKYSEQIINQGVAKAMALDKNLLLTVTTRTEKI